jgi:DNA-binding transcriptional regulator YdaS (Cro superfamily)
MSKKGKQRVCKELEQMRKNALLVAREAMADAVRRFASKSEMARELGVSRQSVNNWMKRGAPVEMCLLIESKTGVIAERLAPLKDWEQLREDAKKVAVGQC